MTTLTTAERAGTIATLRSARRLLVATGWCQHRALSTLLDDWLAASPFHTSENYPYQTMGRGDRITGYCSTGALIHGEPFNVASLARAEAALANVIRHELNYEIQLRGDQSLPLDDRSLIQFWNDETLRSANQVLNLFDRAIASVETWPVCDAPVTEPVMELVPA